MSYGERSKQFDWFKNDNQVKKPKKESAKTVWKFTKIFLYISLFVFSLVGCVQSFVIKTSNYSGLGFEIYDSETNISPHVTQFQFSNIDLTKFTGENSIGDLNGNNVYSVKVNPDSNIYISPSEKENDQLVLKNIHDTIKNQNKGKNLSLSAAWKGINEAFVLNSSDKTEQGAGLNSNGIIHKFNNSENYAVLSSKAENGEYNLGGEFDVNTLSDLKLWIPVLKDKEVKGFTEASFGLYEVKFDNKGLPIPTKKINSTDNPRNLLRISQLNTFFSNNNFYQKFLKVNPETVSKDIKKQQNFNTLQRLAYGEIIKYLGIDDALNDKSEIKEFKMYDNHMPISMFGETDYRPIINWNDAWSLGPFYGLFIYPFGKVFTLMLGSMPFMQGWDVLLAIVITVIISRIITFLLSFKSTLQQTKMQELQAKKAIIDAKYAPYQGNKQMENRKRMETADLYKKAGINPLGAIGTVFVTMPIFLALWRIISGVQEVKSTIWLGINFSSTSYQELFKGQLQYLPLIILAALTQLFAQIYPRLLTRKKEKHQINVYQKAAMKKNNKTQNIMMGVMVFMSLIFSAGIQIYWIIGGIWRIFEVYITHKILHHHKKRSSKKKNLFETTSLVKN